AVRPMVDKPLRVIDLTTGKTLWRLPPGIVQGDTLVHQDGRRVTWYDAATGQRTGGAVLEQHGAFVLVGLSQRATRAVLARTQKRATTFVLLSRQSTHTVTLAGHDWSFDALSGQFLYLIQTLRLGYEVRLYDLATNTLQPRPLKDPSDGALIQGAPFARASSPNGRYLFTLYLGGDGGAMIHELDLAAGRAYCIDLPGDGNFDAATTWALVPDVDGSTLWVVSPGYGRVVAVDVQAHVIRERFSFSAPYWTANAGVAVEAPDGKHIAFSDGQHVWLAIPDLARVVREPAHAVTGLGWAPDQSTLWVVGERSRVSRLAPLRWRCARLPRSQPPPRAPPRRCRGSRSRRAIAGPRRCRAKGSHAPPRAHARSRARVRAARRRAACAEPVVLGRGQAVPARDLRAGLVELAVHLHDRLEERRDRDDVLEARHRIAHAHLDRAEAGMRPDVPPDVRVVGDAPGALELADDLGVVLVVAEARRRPGAWERGEHHLPARREAGRLAPPERRRRRQCEHLRQVHEEAVHHLDRLLGIVDCDVHVHAEDQLAPRDVLQLVDEVAVTVAGRDPLALEERERVGAR